VLDNISRFHRNKRGCIIKII